MMFAQPNKADPLGVYPTSGANVNPITPAFIVMTLFWWAFGATFLERGAVWRFLAYVLAWQLFTPDFAFWVDSLLLLGSFTVFEMAIRALMGRVRKTEIRTDVSREGHTGAPMAAS